MTRKARTHGPCILCGRDTRAGGVWQKGTPLGPGGKLAYFYDGCKGYDPMTFELIECMIEGELAKGGQWVPLERPGDGER